MAIYFNLSQTLHMQALYYHICFFITSILRHFLDFEPRFAWRIQIPVVGTSSFALNLLYMYSSQSPDSLPSILYYVPLPALPFSTPDEADLLSSDEVPNLQM